MPVAQLLERLEPWTVDQRIANRALRPELAETAQPA
jgi:hypothetical protein